MSLISSFLEIIVGWALIVGEPAVRRIFTELLGFYLYIHCNIATTLLSFTNNLFEEELYENILEMYRTIPFNVIHHLFLYPETYVFFGWLIFVYGCSKILYYFNKICYRV